MIVRKISCLFPKKKKEKKKKGKQRETFKNIAIDTNQINVTGIIFHCVLKEFLLGRGFLFLAAILFHIYSYNLHVY